MARLLLLVPVLLLASCDWSAAPRSVEPVPLEGLREGIWVYEDVISDPEDAAELIGHASMRGINTLYLNVYRSVPNAEGRRLHDEERLTAFLRDAQRAGLEVWATYSTVTWQELGGGEGTFPHERMREVAAFNRTHGAPFDGVMLNVEPPEPADLEALLLLMTDLSSQLSDYAIPLAMTLRHFWEQPLDHPQTGRQMEAYRHFIDLPLDHLVVMSYRDFAGSGCGEDDGIICLSEREISYAGQAGATVVVGLRDTSVERDGGVDRATFHGRTEGERQRERERVRAAFADSPGFGGFATHAYAGPSGAGS